MKNLLTLFILIFTISCSQKMTQTIPTPKAPEIPVKTKSQKTLKQESMANVAVGQPLPNGGIYALDDGRFYRMAAFSGQLLIIDFWATWCGPCISAMPKFHKLAEKYQADNKVAFISISIDKSQNTWANYVLDRKWEGNHYWLGLKKEDPLFGLLYRKMDTPAGEIIAVGVPRYVIISPEGTILDTEGRISRPEYEEMLKKYIAKL